MSNEQAGQVMETQPRGGFGADLPLRAWIFATIVGTINAAATVFFVQRAMASSHITTGLVIGGALSLALVLFTFGAVREGFRLERALIKARLEVVIEKLAQ